MRRNKEAGQALFLAAASLVVLIGMLGLAIDVGMLRYDKRIQQTAADAAAVAGANNLAWEGGGTVVCAGQNASIADGFADTSGGGGCANGDVGTCSASTATVGTVCVQVYHPPSSGPHAGAANYVEAFVSVVQPTYFMRIFGVTKHSVTARAVATDVSGGTNAINCFYTLGNPSNEIGVDPFGHTTINATNCGIVDNGNFDPTGNALTINACSFQVSGMDTGNNAGNVLCNSKGLTPSYGSPSVQDPFANQLTKPTVGTPINGCCSKSASSVSPGTYNGITVKSNLTFQPGVYVVTGGNPLDCGSNKTMTGTGVMFYFTNGSTLNCQGGDTLNLTAMNTSQAQAAGYPKDAGILMYQDPNDTNTGIPTTGGKSPCPPPGSGSNTGPELSGNDGSTLNGILYFPAAQLYLTGNSGTTTLGPAVMYTACMGGNSTFNVQGTTGLPITLPTLSNSILVE